MAAASGRSPSCVCICVCVTRQQEAAVGRAGAQGQVGLREEADDHADRAQEGQLGQKGARKDDEEPGGVRQEDPGAECRTQRHEKDKGLFNCFAWIKAFFRYYS